MKDIDFDELDRAVSSVLGQKEPVAVETVAKTTTDAGQKLSVTLPSKNDSSSEIAVTSQPKSPAETRSDQADVSTRPELNLGGTARPQNPFTTKPRGKFMDVMHPSADMSSSSPEAPSPKMTHTTIEPLTSLLTEHVDATSEEEQKEPEISLEPVVDVDESKTLIGAEPIAAETAESTPSDVLSFASVSPSTIVEDKKPASSGYVDPLAAFDAAEPTVGNNDAEDTENIEDAPTSTASNNFSPQPSPFLSDTKVDKRPLGGFGDTESSLPDSDKPDNISINETDATNESQAAPVAVSLPRELQPDVVEVEAVHEREVIQDSSAKTSSSPFATTIAPAKADDDDRVEGHPLFDTSTYHEPIVAVNAKKTAPWVWWLVGLILCLIVGAGVGYFLFTAGL